MSNVSGPKSPTLPTQPSVLDRAKELKAENQDTLDNARKLTLATKSIASSAKAGWIAVKDVKEQGWDAGTDAFRSSKLEAATNRTGSLEVAGKLGLLGKSVGVVTGLARIPRGIANIAESAKKVIQASAGDDTKTAMTGLGRDIRDTAYDATQTAKAALQTSLTAQKLTSTYRAASAAFEAVAPHALPSVTKAAATEAMKQVFTGAVKAKNVARAVEGAALDAAKAIGGTLGPAKGLAAATGETSRIAAKATIEGASKAAAEAAAHAGVEVAGKGLAKAAARFAPGANVAMAVIDTAVAVATIRDPKASLGSKITSGITAVGSIAAATNIPIVSQVGAAVSVVSGLVGAFFITK